MNSTTLAFAVFGLVVLAFAAVVGVLLIVGAWRMLRKPTPPPTQRLAPPPNDGYFASIQRQPAPPPPDLEDQFFDYGQRRKRENERQKYRDTLDKVAGIVGPDPVPKE